MAMEVALPPHAVYEDLCEIENLRQAYASLKDRGGADERDLVAVEADGLDDMLRQLSHDLRARTYQPISLRSTESLDTFPSFPCGDRVRDGIVEVGVAQALGQAFPADLTCDPTAEAAMKWMAGAIGRGLTRVYMASIDEPCDPERHDWLMEQAAKQVGDPKVIDLLQKILGRPDGPNAVLSTEEQQASGAADPNLASDTQPSSTPSPPMLASTLANVAYAGVDRMLQQTRIIGRRENLAHVACARFGHRVIVLVDGDPHFEWLLPAEDKRLREAVSEMKCTLDPAKTEVVDLARGDHLQVLGFKIRAVTDRRGVRRAQFERIEESEHGIATSFFARLRQRWLVAGRSVGPRGSRRKGRRRGYDNRNRWAKTLSIEVGWRHLPITLCPILALMFGWRSPITAMCAVAIVLFSWRDIPAWVGFVWGRTAAPVCRRLGLRLPAPVVTSVVGVWNRVQTLRPTSDIGTMWRKLLSMQVGWRHLPITLCPVVALICGWRSPVTALCAVAIVVCNWQPITRLAWRRRAAMMMAACLITLAVCVRFFALDVYENSSHESSAAQMPEGFYLGQYYVSSDADPVQYGLYVPPHFRKESGPFPLIMMLHGYGERTPQTVFKVGLPDAIKRLVDNKKTKGRFDFVAFVPMDPQGTWETGTDTERDIMATLDYVVQRHHIDPNRIYLTGLSAGGSGVWRYAEAHPDRWAALAPACSFNDPDIDKVRHIPAWIFHGANDMQAPVERDRALVEKLKKAGADVRYTEFPDKFHAIGLDTYNTRGLYRWFATKTKP
jgi:predicted esterase